MLDYRKDIDNLPVYDVVERDWNIKVNANESGWNLPPLVEERVLSSLSRIAFNRYPNTEPEDLSEIIAKRFGLQKENVWLGNGSSEIIDKIFYAFGGEGHKIVYMQPSFSMYPICVKSADAEGIAVPLDDDYKFNAEKFIEAVKSQKASLAVVCNPNNPTGGLIPVEDIEKIAKEIDCAFLVDEAYVEFSGKKASAVSLMSKYPHLMVARTFSKAFGLAAIRVGYLLADKDIISTVGKVFKPYYLNVLSTVVASVVMQMYDEFDPRIEMVISERDRMYEEFLSLPGVKVYPSDTNFLLLRYDKAKELNERLLNYGIGVRSFGNAPMLDNCLRISIGTPEENNAVMKVIRNFAEGR